MIGENMVKVAIYPPNSLILADLIERKGHTPLVLQKQIRQKTHNHSTNTSKSLSASLAFVDEGFAVLVLALGLSCPFSSSKP